MFLKNTIHKKAEIIYLFHTHLKSQPYSILYTFITAAVAAQINYIFFGVPAYFFIFIMLAHEFGHYLYGKKNKGFASYPLIFAIPGFAVGITKVKNLYGRQKSETALAGMFLGALTALIFLLINIINYYISYMIILFFMLWELFYNYFLGSDGRKYRYYKNL